DGGGGGSSPSGGRDDGGGEGAGDFGDDPGAGGSFDDGGPVEAGASVTPGVTVGGSVGGAGAAVGGAVGFAEGAPAHAAGTRDEKDPIEKLKREYDRLMDEYMKLGAKLGHAQLDGNAEEARKIKARMEQLDRIMVALLTAQDRLKKAAKVPPT